MFDNIGHESGHTMQVRSMLKLIVGVALSLGFVIAATTTVAAPKAGAVEVGRRTLVAQQNLIDSSTTKTPTLTPTYQPTTQAQSPRAPLSAQTIPGQPQVDPNTVLLYHFDSSAGSDVIDATGNYTGTLFGTATITSSGLYSGGLQLDGNGSYVRTGYVGDLSQGTIEAFVDFRSMCYTAAENFPLITAGGGFGSNQTTLYLGDLTGLRFGIYANGQWNWVDSGVNACRYLTGYAGLPFPYDPVTFHHVAATWGPRGMEIWIDGVLHGVGNNDPNAGIEPYPYMCNPQMQFGIPPRPPNPNAPYTCPTPVMYPTMATFPPGDYTGGLPAYSTFLIGCDSSGACFNGRMDEVRISNIQRTFTLAVVPTPTPTFTVTPINYTGEYTVDGNTINLYHFNPAPPGEAWEEVHQQYKYLLGQAVIEPGGRFGTGLDLGNSGGLGPGNLGSPLPGTAEAWVYISNPNANSIGRIPIFTAVPSGSTNWDFFLGVPGFNNKTLSLYINNGTISGLVDSGIYPSALANCWHHIAGTWGSRGLEIWIDGVLENTNSSYTGGLVGGTNNWIVGCDLSGNCMNGMLDEVRVSGVQYRFTATSLNPVRRSPSYGSGPNSGQGSLFLPFVGIAPSPTPCG